MWNISLFAEFLAVTQPSIQDILSTVKMRVHVLQENFSNTIREKEKEFATEWLFYFLMFVVFESVSENPNRNYWVLRNSKRCYGRT